MVKTGDIPTNRPCSKLDYTFLGPYKIIREINPRAFELDLPKSSRLHRVFHVSQLEKYTVDKFHHRQQPPPPPIHITAEDQQYYEVESILDYVSTGPTAILYPLERLQYPRTNMGARRILESDAGASTGDRRFPSTIPRPSWTRVE